MSLVIQYLSRNIVCILQLDKKRIDREILHNLIQGEYPAIINPGDEIPLLLINYQRAGFQIAAMEHNLQITSTAPVHAKATKEFSLLAKRVLEAFNGHAVRAYGFNFSYLAESVDMNVMKHFNIQLEKPGMDAWSIVSNTSIRLMFEKGDVKFTLNLTDEVGRGIKVDVNVHHEESMIIDELSKKIEMLYNEASGDSLALLKAVLA